MSEVSSVGSGPPKSPIKSNSPYKVYRQGFLLKIPPRALRKKLQRYWFVLFKQKDMLAFLYFQDEDHYLERKKNEGFFRIDDCTSIDVIPEHVGRKNAFCITTPRNKYFLVSESRYELHHWLFALHGAMDDYKKEAGGKKKQQQNSLPRQRSLSTTSPPSSLTRPSRIKPSRPAPPAPPKKKGDEENIPPQPQHTVSSDSFRDLPSPTTSKLDDIVAGLLSEDHNGPRTLEYTLTEDEDIPLVNGDTRDETESFSTSLPALNDPTADRDTNTSTLESNSDEDQLSHTRHLSFSGSCEFNSKGSGKRKSGKKRAGSIKGGRRSVSPPNLPPPPPPPDNMVASNGEHCNGENEINKINQGNTNGDIASNPSPKPSPPKRTTSLNNPNVDMGVAEYLDEAFLQEDDDDQFDPPVIVNSASGDGKSPGILRKGEHAKSSKRTVAFEESMISDRYEPRVDHEPIQGGNSNFVATAKAKLFGQTAETESYRYKRTQLQDSNNYDPSHDLLEAIETALQPTSYMEDGSTATKQMKPTGFCVEVKPPTIPPPIRPTGDTGAGGYTLETSPEAAGKSPGNPWDNDPTALGDTPTSTTFTHDPNTVYRSFV